MKRAETIKTLTRILQQREIELAILQTTIAGLQMAIREVEVMDDDWFSKPQQGTFKQEITDAMCDALKDGPLHRSVILKKIQEHGLHVGGGVRTLGAYLSMGQQFKNVGKGKWSLISPDESPSPNGLLPLP